MDAATWAVVVSPISALIGVLGGLGGFWLAGRNDEARDQRAAHREERARRDALAERLEEDRHSFQRDTLLELQDELQRLARNTAVSMSQDRKTISEQGRMFLPPEPADEGRQIVVAVQRLRSRVLDDNVRARVGKYVELCTGLALNVELLLLYPGGIVPDRKAALSALGRQSTDMATAYQELTELLGEHLRGELDRRYLVAAPEPDQGAPS